MKKTLIAITITSIITGIIALVGCRTKSVEPGTRTAAVGWEYEGWACAPDSTKLNQSPGRYCQNSPQNDYLYMKFSAAASQRAIDSGQRDRMEATCRESARLQIAGDGLAKIIGEYFDKASGVSDGQSTGVAILSRTKGYAAESGPAASSPRRGAPGGPGQPKSKTADKPATKPAPVNGASTGVAIISQTKGNTSGVGLYNCCAIDNETGRCAAPGKEDWQQCMCVGYMKYPGGQRAFESMAASVVQPDYNTEEYDRIYENPYQEVVRNPLSTFSIDVDTASYSNVRRFLTQGQLPPKGAVRIEELVNYFTYDYPAPKGEDPFSVSTEVSVAPWNAAHRLIHIGIAGRQIKPDKIPPRNLVFLLDVSGSMSDYNKLPLLKQAMLLLVKQLTAEDRITIVVYAGASGLALPPTPGNRKQTILSSIARLEAGGSTNGGEGIELAYRMAEKNFIKGGINRVILGTDGDFNVGTTSQSELVQLIEKKREKGVFLTVLGFGMGNYKDSMMEKLADKGNGNYAYIDTFAEARKVLVHQVSGTLVTIAKDVKLQLEFNPRLVKAYRLIGYENRVLADQDFNDDKKDAGDIGAGHTVTSLYEIIPAGSSEKIPGIDPLKYQTQAHSAAAAGGELLTVKIRYKQPDGNTSKLISFPVLDRGLELANTSNNFRFAAALAGFGMILRESEYKGSVDFKQVRELAQGARGNDPEGYRAEFIRLLGAAESLK